MEGLICFGWYIRVLFPQTICPVVVNHRFILSLVILGRSQVGEGITFCSRVIEKRILPGQACSADQAGLEREIP